VPISGEPAVLVRDNAGYHKSHELRAWWQQHADRLQTFWLPAYTPQLKLLKGAYRHHGSTETVPGMWSVLAG
jgi:DDE superfamily endonuclease